MDSCLFPFIVIVGVCSIFMLATYFENKTILEVWGKFAQNAGLTLMPGSTFLYSLPRVTGTYKGFDYQLYKCIKRLGQGKTSATFTIIEITFPAPLDCHLNIYTDKRHMGERDNIETGDREFDKVFIIKSQTPQKIAKLLTQELRQKMLSRQIFIDISLSGQGISYTASVRGLKDTGAIEYLSDIMSELAKNACKIEGITGQERERITDSGPSYEQSDGDFTGNSSRVQSDRNGEKLCSSCGASVPVINRFCLNCGKQL